MMQSILGLQKKRCLSTEAFRQLFRSDKKRPEALYVEFAYSLRSNLVEWLKNAEVYGDHGRVAECFGLEQLYKIMPDATRYWVQDKILTQQRRMPPNLPKSLRHASTTQEHRCQGAGGDYHGKG